MAAQHVRAPSLSASGKCVCGLVPLAPDMPSTGTQSYLAAKVIGCPPKTAL
jgi:hypothetical protein